MNHRKQIIKDIISSVENELKERPDVYHHSNDPMQDYTTMVFLMKEVEKLKATPNIEKKEPVIYSWPESQICMECDHGQFIMSDKFTNSEHLCSIGCNDNNGVSCPGNTAE